MKNKLRFGHRFLRRLHKLQKYNMPLARKVKKILTVLEEHPFHSMLKSHKVHDDLGRLVYSSKVTKDLRISWDFHHDEPGVIVILNLGGHSGRNKVYM